MIYNQGDKVLFLGDTIPNEPVIFEGSYLSFSSSNLTIGKEYLISSVNSDGSRISYSENFYYQ